MKQFAAILVFLAVLFAPLSVSSYQVVPSSLSPGENGVIQVTLENVQPSGSTTVGDPVEDVAIYYSSVAGIEFTASNPVRVGTISGGSSAIATIPIHVAADAKGGIISAPLSIYQRDASSRQTLLVPVTIDNPPIFTVSTDKRTIKGIDTLIFKIANDGGDASRLTIKLNSTSKFSFINSDQVFVGQVNGTAYVSIEIDSRNADDGTNKIPLLLTYQKEGGEYATEVTEVPITVKKDQSDIELIQNSTLVTSRDDILVILLRNTGAELHDFRIELVDADVKARESAEISIGNLSAGQERILSMPVFTDVEPGILDVSFELKWMDGGVEKTEILTIPIVVSSDADVGIFVDAKPTPLTVSGEHTLAILVSNIGSYRIENVEVALDESGIMDILNAQTSQYIGGLDNDDFSTVQYKIKLKDIEPGFYPLNLTVKYKDQSGVWVVKQVSTEVTVKPQVQSGNSILTIIIVLAIVAAILYWYFKKRKNREIMKQ